MLWQDSKPGCIVFIHTHIDRALDTIIVGYSLSFADGARDAGAFIRRHCSASTDLAERF